MMKAKVAAIDEQERLRRLRMQNMGMQVLIALRSFPRTSSASGV
jgi:hypothetical protein